MGGVFFCAGYSANIAPGKPSGDYRSKCREQYFALVASVQEKNPKQIRFALDFQISTEATKAVAFTILISNIFIIQHYSTTTMDENVDENELVAQDVDDLPLAIAESAALDNSTPDSEPGEILQLLRYPENVVDQPEAAKMLTAALQSKSKMEKYKKDFFNTVCCLVGLEVGDSPTTHLNDIYQRCMTIYSKLLENNGAALLANTIGIFVHLPGGAFPSDILQFLLSFLTKGFNLETRTAAKALKVVSSEAETSTLMRGKVVWDTFMDTKKTVNNVHNPLYREPKSGENLAGVLLQIRMTLHKENAKDLEKSRLLRVSRTMPEFIGFAKSNIIANARMAWNNTKMLDFNYAGFEDDWYPAVWMIFFLCGLPAGDIEIILCLDVFVISSHCFVMICYRE